MKRIPPVLEYLLDSVQHWPARYLNLGNIGRNDRLYIIMEDWWPLANEIEKAWTGVGESDRAIISKLVPQDDHMFLIMVCLLRGTDRKSVV